MHLPYLFGALSVLLFRATATPSAAKACSTVTTFTANFETLPTEASVYNGYGGVDWVNFDVGPDGYYDLYYMKPIGKKWAESYYNNFPSINQASNSPRSYYPNFLLKNFHWACADTDPYSAEPTPCTMMILGIDETGVQNITTYGPWKYDPGDWRAAGGANLSKVVVNASTGRFVFILIKGPREPLLRMDNVVIVNQNLACVGGA